jgi:hypothetical protein
MIALATANNTSIKNGYTEPKNLLRIPIELEPRQNPSTNSAVAEGPVNPQDIPSKMVSETDTASAVDENKRVKLFVTQEFLVKALNVLGYKC